MDGLSEQEIWAGIEADYLSGEMTVQAIADKWGRSASTIYKKATSLGWKKKLQKIRQKADEIVIARRARVRAKELESMYEASASMSKLLKKTVEALHEKPIGEVVKSLKGVSALATAMDTNVRTLMTLHGIQTPAQIEAQKIAKARLKLEERKQAMLEDQQEDENRDREVKLTISVRGRDNGADADTESDEE